MLGGPVPLERMPDVWSLREIALVHQRGDPLFSTVIPRKTFEALGVGKPILTAQLHGEAEEIVLSARAGEWVQPETPIELAKATRELAAVPEQATRYATNAEGAPSYIRAMRMLPKLTTVASR